MKNSREKGAAGERELANILKDYGYKTRRGQQYCGSNGDADVVGLPGIHIECKRVEKFTLKELNKAMEQSINDAKDDEIPVVIHRKNFERDWKVTIRIHDLVSVYRGSMEKESCFDTVATMSLEGFINLYQARKPG